MLITCQTLQYICKYDATLLKTAHTTYLVQNQAISMLQQRYDTRICPPWCFSHAESVVRETHVDAGVFIDALFICRMKWNSPSQRLRHRKIPSP